MSGTRFRVDYVDGEPKKVRFGRGLMGGTCSLASMDGGTAVIIFDNAGSTDFQKELMKLPFVEEIHDDSQKTNKSDE